MKYEPISSELFIQNRKRFCEQLKPNSIAIFHSNDILPTNADGTMPFKQNTDLFYLSGIDQEESILVIYPDSNFGEFREVLFLKETSEEIAIWEGHKYTKEEATATSGIRTIKWLPDFKKVFHMLMSEAEHVYVSTNEHWRADISVETRDSRFIKWCKEFYPVHQYERVNPVMHRLRSVKSQLEIDQIQKACDITNRGFRRVLEFIKPGVMEYEIEAEFIHEFIRSRSAGFAYAPIIASGYNACVLHYIDNNKECKDGDLILFDVGAEYANYNADMSRTVPVSGRFTDRQKAVYNAVLRVKEACANDLLVPGTTIVEYHKEVGKLMESELLGLGLLDKADIQNQNPEWPAYKKYFMHGTSHYLGLDVHDYGGHHATIQEGMVFTIEPGIYIPEENMGIRLEDNYVIQDGKPPVNLMKDIPLSIEEIEDIMNR